MDGHENHTFQFGRFLLEVEQRRLRRDDEIISITPKAFDTLLVLLRNRGQIVEKEQLLNEVWADTFVEEGTLAQNISTIRRVLSGANGDLVSNGDLPMIETIPRRGYRFIGEVNERISFDKYVVVDRQIGNVNGSDPTVSSNSVGPSNGSKQATDAGFSLPSLPQKISFLRRRKWKFAIAAAGCVALVYFVVISPTLIKLADQRPFSRVKFMKLTSSGQINRIALSPDGRYIAFAEKRDAGQALFIKQISSENIVEIVAPGDFNFVGVTFSPDGESIYYVTHSATSGPNVKISKWLYRIPMLGGAPQQVLENIDSPIAFSSNGERIAFVRNDPAARETAIIVADSNGVNEQKVAIRPSHERFMPDGIAWSPDDQFIAAPARKVDSLGVQMQALSVNVATGEQISLSTRKWDWVGQMSWLKDGNAVVFPAYGEESQNLTDEIWMVDVTSGETRQLTNGINGYFGLGSAANSKSLITVKSDFFTTLQRTSLNNPQVELRTSEGFSEYSLLNLGMVFSPDGSIVFSSLRNGNVDMWVAGSDGNDQRQITSDKAAEFFPKVSPDGHTIVYISNRSGRFDLWRMNIDGTGAHQLTDGQSVSSPSISPDGGWVYYSSFENGTLVPFIWKIPIDGGESIQVNSIQTYKPQVSPDGKFVACYYPLQNGPARSLALSILSAANGQLVRQFDNTTIQMIPDLSPAISWTPDGQNLLFVQESSGVPTIWIQPLSETRPKLLTTPGEAVYRYALSPDGKDLITEKGTQINNIILIEDTDS